MINATGIEAGIKRWADAGYSVTAIALAFRLDRKTVTRVGFKLGLTFGKAALKPYWVATLSQAPKVPENLQGQHELYNRVTEGSLTLPPLDQIVTILRASYGAGVDEDRVASWWVLDFKQRVTRNKLRAIDRKLCKTT